MALHRVDVANAAVPALVVVPMHEAPGPLPGGIRIGEPLERERRPILGRAIQRLGEGVVIADPRAAAPLSCLCTPVRIEPLPDLDFGVNAGEKMHRRAGVKIQQGRTPEGPRGGLPAFRLSIGVEN